MASTPKPLKKKKKRGKKRHDEVDEIDEPIEFATPVLPQAKKKKTANPNFAVGDEFALVEGNAVLDGAEDSDHEIWMIQVPHNYDVSQLNDQMVLLQGEQLLTSGTASSNSATSDVRFHSVASRYENGESNPCQVLVPSESVDGEFRGVSGQYGCAGSLRVLRTVSTESTQQTEPTPDSRAKRKPLPPGLKVRHQPFGADEPVRVPRKKRKKSRRP